MPKTLDLPRCNWKSPDVILTERVQYATSHSTQPFRELSFYRGKKILLWTRKPGFGDRVMTAICCQLLRERFGLDVWMGIWNDARDREFSAVVAGVPFYEYRPDVRGFPLKDHAVPRGFEGGNDHTGAKHPFDFIIDFRYQVHSSYNAIFQCLMEFGVRQLDIPISGLQVHNLPRSTAEYDVVLCTNCGGWKPVRAYRRRSELVELLCAQGLSVLDLAASDVCRAFGTAQLLAIVKNSRVWVGVETGPTHLVSGVHRQAIVIQAGIHASAFWNIYDRTIVIESDWSCGGRQCQVRRHAECSIPEGVCIDRYAPADIVKLVDQVL